MRILRDLEKLHHFMVSTSEFLFWCRFTTGTKHRVLNNGLFYWSPSLAGFHPHRYPKKTGACTCTLKPDEEMCMLIQCFFSLPFLDYSYILLWQAQCRYNKKPNPNRQRNEKSGFQTISVLSNAIIIKASSNRINTFNLQRVISALPPYHLWERDSTGSWVICVLCSWQKDNHPQGWNMLNTA